MRDSGGASTSTSPCAVVRHARTYPAARSSSESCPLGSVMKAPRARTLHRPQTPSPPQLL